MPNDKEVELEFPLSGIDVTTEFQEQKPGTTPEAINVRAFDPIARRARGGSRRGIAHYAPNPVPANVALDMTIQHLAVIVDPHATALPQNFITPGDDWVADPLNPGTVIPPGGWGNPGGPPAPTANIQFRQRKEGSLSSSDDASGVLTISLDDQPANGDTVIVCVRLQTSWLGDQVTPVDPFSTLTVKNGAALAYTQDGVNLKGESGDLVLDPMNPQLYQWNRLRIYYHRSTGIATDKSVIITYSPGVTGEEPNAGMNLNVDALVYRNVASGAAIIANSGSHIDLQSQTSIDAGNVTVEDGCLLVALVCNFNDATFTPTLTDRVTSIDLRVGDRFPMHIATDNPTNVNAASAGNSWPAILAVTFKKTP